MKLCEFLHFNHHCPICGEKLTLFMQWFTRTNAVCFKGVPIDQDLYRFMPYLGGEAEKGEVNFWEEGMLLKDYGESFETQIINSRLMQEAKKYQIYFFYLCNPKGFDTKNKAFGDYDISMYKGCYFRSTVEMEFRRDDDQESKNWSLQVTNPDSIDIVNKEESYAIKTRNDKVEKVYLINLDNEQKTTTLWHYSVTEEQRKIKDWEPKLFKTEMPLLPSRPDVSEENREKLVNRFDSWIIMS